MSGSPSYGDLAWFTSRRWLAPIAKAATRGRGYGLDRIPKTGGCVVAINHLVVLSVKRSPDDVGRASTRA